MSVSSVTKKQVEEIYYAYPRRVGKQKAFIAIRKALTVIDVEHNESAAWLLERVQMYARSSAGQAGKFTPYPATWFNQGRYDDDPAEWHGGKPSAELGPGQVSVAATDKHRDQQRAAESQADRERAEHLAELDKLPAPELAGLLTQATRRLHATQAPEDWRNRPAWVSTAWLMRAERDGE
jgi:hypothetical protein